MNLPSEIFIAPHRIPITFVPDLKDAEGGTLFGQYHPLRLQIEIHAGLAPTRTAEILFHEVLHALHDASPFVNSEDEEGLVQALAPALVRLMQDNPEFFAALQQLSARP